MLRGMLRDPIGSTDHVHEIGMAKPFAIVEKGDDLGGNPKQHYVFQLSRRVACDLREFLEHQLARLLRLLWIRNRPGSAAERQTTNVVPVRVWQDLR